MCEKIIIKIELRSSKNSRQFVRMKNGRTLLLKSKLAIEQDRILDEELKKNFNKWKNMISQKCLKPLKVCFFVYRGSKRRWDWLNIIQGLSDSMVKAGYIEDDSAEFFTPVFLGFEIDKNNPRVEISLE